MKSKAVWESVLSAWDQSNRMRHTIVEQWRKRFSNTYFKLACFNNLQRFHYPPKPMINGKISSLMQQLKKYCNINLFIEYDNFKKNFLNSRTTQQLK